MPAITIKALAKGIISKIPKDEREKIIDVLVTKGRQAACTYLCAIIKARTGLSKALCEPICDQILTKLASEIRKRLS